MSDKMKKKSQTKEKQGTFTRLIIYMKPWWGMLIAVSVLSFLGSFLNVLAPDQMKNIVNEIQIGIKEGIDLSQIRQQTIVTIGILAAGFLCNFIQSRISPKVSHYTSRALRSEINSKTNRIPLSYFDTTPEGEVMSTMTNDVDTVATSFGNTLPSLLISVTTLIGCVVLMLITNWILAVATILVAVVGLMLNIVIMNKGLVVTKKKQNGLGAINSRINEAFRGHMVIKAFGAEAEVLDVFHKENEQLKENVWKSQFFNLMIMPISTFVGNLGYIVVCVLGTALVLKGMSMIGTVIAFIQYAQLFTNNLSTFAQAMGNIQPAMASSERIFEFLDENEMVDTGMKKVETEKVTGNVDFEHVKFGYNPNAIILHDFSCKVEAGQKIAIVGPTGAGKSTLINLLIRFYELNGGDILIDGISIKEMPREQLHNMISMVLQETWTFEGSIRDNIVYAKKNVTKEQFENVCKKTGLDTLLKTYADGAETILGEECGVSAGQKQLITIARAMLDDAPILILDEATSSVDTRTEKIISQAIDELMKGRTSFVIAHRLSTIKNADLILVLKDGDIIETGTHEQLMSKDGFYADLYRSQFEKVS